MTLCGDEVHIGLTAQGKHTVGLLYLPEGLLDATCAGQTSGPRSPICNPYTNIRIICSGENERELGSFHQLSLKGHFVVTLLQYPTLPLIDH